jgi:FKBP-type peptidyl-prolyl cis-trans isomerase FkpA
MRVSHGFIAVVAAWWLTACGSTGVETEEQKNLYALGLSLAERLGPFKGQLTPEELEPVKRGLLDVAREQEPAVALGEYLPKVGAMSERMRGRAAKAYLDRAAEEEGARRLPSGVVYQELREGTGAHPGPKDSLLVRIKGTLMDGTVFEEFEDPTPFNLLYATFGFTKGIKEMREGGKARILVPSGMAYKDKQAGIVPPNSLLIYEVELFKIEGKYVEPWKQRQATGAPD